MLNQFSQEGAHACHQIELGVGMQRWEIDANCEGMHLFDHVCHNHSSFKSFRLVRMHDGLKQGVGGLGGHHSGVIR